MGRPARGAVPDATRDVSPKRVDATHYREDMMTQVQFKESWDQLKGAVRRKWGELTDEEILRIDGDQGRFTDTVQQRYGLTKGEVSQWADRWYAKWIGWYEGYEEAKPVPVTEPRKRPAR